MFTKATKCKHVNIEGKNDSMLIVKIKSFQWHRCLK